jgi:hypothetical protein
MFINNHHQQSSSKPQMATPLFLSPHDILKKKNSKKFIEINRKKLRKKVTLFKTDYEKGRLQPTPAGHPQLATPRANYFLLVYLKFFY